MEQGGYVFCDTAGDPSSRLEPLVKKMRSLPDMDTPAVLPPRDAAILFEPDNARADHLKSERPLPYLDALIKAYLPFRQHGVALDVTGFESDWSAYRLLVMPAMLHLGPEDAEKLIEYVRGGGILLASAPTAHKDRHGVFHRKMCDPLLELMGFRMEESGSGTGPVTATLADGVELADLCVCERVTADPATILASVKDGDSAGLPAALLHRFGKGMVFYTPTRSLEMNEWLGQRAAEAAGLDWLENPHPEVALFPHLTDPKKMWCLNHDPEPRVVLGHSVPAESFLLINL
jgi:beta-galactosidase